MIYVTKYAKHWGYDSSRVEFETKTNMKNLPKKIYLQVDPDGEMPDDFKELAEVTWCSERINKSVIEYVLNEEEN